MCEFICLKTTSPRKLHYSTSVSIRSLSVGPGIHRTERSELFFERSVRSIFVKIVHKVIVNTSGFKIFNCFVADSAHRMNFFLCLL